MQQPGAANPGASVDDAIEAQRLNVDTMKRNIRQVDLARIVLYMAVGTICGVCGFTSMKGFLFYIIASLAITCALAATMGFNTKAYINETFFELFISSMSGQIMSFIMFWTLFYSLVFVY